ncbi:MAG: hypothetical protein F6J94_25155 [Moorea sp. SIO1F2]|nr:hypothetical protein [Moorena sp. SIO3I7]NET85082.1 hypothetical protein [Moorena sp. SIO1F2]
MRYIPVREASFALTKTTITLFRESGIGNRESGIGNREQGTGNREQKKLNP